MRNLDKYFQNDKFLDFLSSKGLDMAEIQDLNDLLNIEWEMLDKVQDIESRTYCQDDRIGFLLIRTAQYLMYSALSRRKILRDFRLAREEGRNLVEEKYARCSKITDPDLYQRVWADRLEKPSPVKEEKIRQILRWSEMMILELKENEERMPSGFRQKTGGGS